MNLFKENVIFTGLNLISESGIFSNMFVSGISFARNDPHVRIFFSTFSTSRFLVARLLGHWRCSRGA